MSVCQECSTELREGAKFCPQCGGTVDGRVAGPIAVADRQEALRRIAPISSFLESLISVPGRLLQAIGIGRRPTPTIIFSHWYALIDGLQASPKEFYAAVERAVAERQVPAAKNDRVEWKEGGVFSARRQYLRIRRRELVFDICGAPFGTGFFISWWLGSLPAGLLGLLRALPIIGRLIEWLSPLETYYKIDTTLMFQESISRSVQEVLDEITKAQGLRALSELERKPIMRDFLRR